MTVVAFHAITSVLIASKTTIIPFIAVGAINMRTYEAFDLTVKQFNLKAKELAAQSGVSESSISRYRKGEQSLSTDALDNLMAALPHQARQYMVFNHLLSDLDEQAIGTLLYAISLKMRGVVGTPEMERLTA